MLKRLRNKIKLGEKMILKVGSYRRDEFFVLKNACEAIFKTYEKKVVVKDVVN